MLPSPPPPRPDGKLEVEITDLEMRVRPKRTGRIPLTGHTLGVQRALRPTLHFYRYLYSTVGAPYLWFARSRLSDEALKSIIHDERVEILVLYVDGCPAGLAELDRRNQGDPPDEVDITHFGLVPDFLGRGLGLRFLDRVVDLAWQDDPARVTVHVASLDHPRAMLVYQRAGFEPCGTRHVVYADPRADADSDPD